MACFVLWNRDMTGIVNRLQTFLDDNAVNYSVIHHRRDFTARETALDTQTPGREFAKTVFVSIDGTYALAVLRGDDLVAPDKLRAATGTEHVELLTEAEMEELCPDCEVGAAPPFGNLWGLPVYASPALEKDHFITFNGGSHADAIRIRFSDYRRLVKPRFISLAIRD